LLFLLLLLNYKTSSSLVNFCPNFNIFNASIESFSVSREDQNSGEKTSSALAEKKHSK